MRISSCVMLAVLVLAGCGRGNPIQALRPSPSATPDPTEVRVGTAQGPSRISFLSAAPAPGSDVKGCGREVAGCRGRVRMVFSVHSPTRGEALGMIVSLHSPQKRACLFGSTGPLLLEAGRPVTVEVVLDRTDACATPAEISDMAAVLEGTTEIASRQEWGLHYTFSP